MPVLELTLTGFRSYPTLHAAFPPGPQVIVGPNAAGKTNLVEALALVSAAHSHRTRSDQEMIRWGEAFLRVEATVARAAADGGNGAAWEPGPTAIARVEIVVAAASTAGRQRKQIRVNGVPRRSDALPGTLRSVVFAPEAMLLVTGSPSLRRDELDEIAAQRHPGHARRLATYGRALTQRNSLLRAIRDNEAGRDELAYWDRVIVEEGGAMVERRLEMLEELEPALRQAHAEIAPGEAPLGLRYLTNAPAEPGETPSDALRRRLGETAEKELWNGATLVGPHRDDVAFEQDGRDMSSFGSRGQQRTAVLALKLAELDLLARVDGAAPLLLLDDVFSELDPDRRAHLVRRIRALPQAFITTTSLDDLDPALVAQSTAWRVSDGRLERAA